MQSSIEDDSATKRNTDIPDLFSDEEGQRPIIWDRNNASITGTLALTDRALRDQHPEVHRFVTTRTVEERGITFIDNPAKIDMLENPGIKSLAGTFSFDKPCPPSATKARQINDALVLDKKTYDTDDRRSGHPRPAP